MKKPNTDPENFKEVYEYYRQKTPSVILSKLVYVALNKVLRPTIHYADGAQEDIAKIIENRTPRIYIFNHLAKLSVFIPLGVVNEIAADDIGKLRMLGADRHVSGVHSPLFDALGGMPVYRPMDYPDRNLTDAHEALFDCGSHCLLNGQALFASPEGDSNYEDTSKLMKFHRGIGEIAHRTVWASGSEISIIPFGVSDGPESRLTKASACVNRPVIVTPGMSSESITYQARERLQDAVTMAHELY